MTQKHSTYILLTFLVLFFLPLSMKAQDQIKKEVRVVKPYEPTLSDAFKINILPDMDDNIRVNPNYDYSIVPRKMVSDFDVRPISAAKMVGSPLAKYYKSYLKLGLGNYFTPMAELSINSLRSKDYNYGINFQHQSSSGKVTLDNDKKVFAGYGNTTLDVFGKKLYRRNTLEGILNLNTNTVYNYGYNPEIDTTLEKNDIKQTYLDLGAGVRFSSNQKDSSRFRYDLKTDYHYFQDLQSNKENNILLTMDLAKGTGDKLLGTKVLSQVIIPSESVDSSMTTLFQVSPYITKATSEWRFLIGGHILFEPKQNDVDFAFYPNLHFEFNIIPKIIVAYLTADGHWELNNYRKLARDNYFVIPGLTAEKTRHKLETFAGLKGNFSDDVSYNIRGIYSRVNDLFFFVNDTIGELGNTFHIENDNAEITAFESQVSYSYSDKLSFDIHATVKQYTLDNEEYAWHYPTLKYGIAGHYNLQEKIIVNAEFLGMGKRYAKLYGINSYEAVELKPVMNINLGLEYRYSKILSGFLTLSNITGNRYQQWNYYPAQKFLLMAGFTYSL